MMLTRRRVMEGGGSLLAVFLAGSAALAADDLVEVTMQGTSGGTHVWFDPVGLHVRPGQTVRWTNRDQGNSHTVTAYHPAINGRPRRIPPNVQPFDSGYLLPGESFSMKFMRQGVYDYYCVPHEHAGMVGRIVVGKPLAQELAQQLATTTDPGLTPLPEAALNGFPPVDEIVASGVVHRT